jgi:hypothetical protein
MAVHGHATGIGSGQGHVGRRPRSCGRHFDRQRLSQKPATEVERRLANGTVILFEDIGENTIINLDSSLGPEVHLAISGSGDFVFGGAVEAVPEPSTWAMMLLGFSGLGFSGYRTESRVNVRVV